MPTFPAESLERFASQLLAAGGLSQAEADLVARSLADANLRGHDSHGVMRIPYYLERAAKGEVVPGAPFQVLRETPSILTADGHWGFGQTQARRLTQRTIAKAQATGVGVGTLIHCSHIGRLGQYCEMATAQGLVALMTVNNHGAVRRVAPPGGTAPRLSTNPLAVGVPHEDTPIVIDFCTCVVAEGKVRVKKIAGQPCPDGWLLDSEGRPTNDPNALYTDPPGTILPMGGSQPYKGFGLSLMVEILSGALSGGVCARQTPINPIGNCVFLLVLNPAYFGGTDHFRREVGSLVQFIRQCPRAEGVGEITLPGDPERKTLARRSAEGIPLDEANWAALVRVAKEHGVQPPNPRVGPQ